jgi:hypothetical protein
LTGYRVAHDAVEEVVWGVNAAIGYVGNEPDSPRITTSEIGIVATISADLKSRLEQLTVMRDRLEAATFALIATRRCRGAEQKVWGPGAARGLS